MTKKDKQNLDERTKLQPVVIACLQDKTTQIGKRNRLYIEEIATKTGESVDQVLNCLIAEHEENNLFDEMTTCYTELRKDEAAWQRYLEERDRWGKLNRP